MMYGGMRWFTFAYWMHANLSPIRYSDMYILCCSNRICACPSGRSCLQVTPPSGLCFAGVLIHFRSTNFRRSICPILAKVMPDFSVNFGMTCARICKKYRVLRICVLSILVVSFNRFSINVSTMNIGNVWWWKGFRYLQILRRRVRPVRRNLPR